MSDKKAGLTHKIILEDRELLTITGVNKVKSFDKKEISLETIKGGLLVKGQDLGVKNLDLERSEIEIEGNVVMITYPAGRSGSSSKGVWEKIFK
ncbi:MAG: sporulation protein YabP [Peptococcaceae bacterium]|nr:sporulation protein YabP [Peptococcaceae bacterium]